MFWVVCVCMCLETVERHVSCFDQHGKGQNNVYGAKNIKLWEVESQRIGRNWVIDPTGSKTDVTMLANTSREFP